MEEKYKSVVIETSSGRKLQYKEMSPGELLDFILACEDGAKNQTYMNTSQAWCGVRAVDGIPIPFPKDRNSIREIANTLGEDGVNALDEYFGKVSESAMVQTDQVKN